MAFSYLLDYAGVPFCLDEGKVFRMSMKPPSTEVESSLGPKKYQPLSDLIDELDRLLPFCYLDDFGPQVEELGHNLNALAVQQYSNKFPNPQVKIGDWYYPSGATRWSVFRGLATSSQVSAMMLAVGASTPQIFTMRAAPVSPDNPTGSDTNYTLSSPMYMLPPRPLAEHGGRFDGLYLVTLVDERYYWQYAPISLRVNKDTTWALLLSQLVTVLGITLTVDPIATAYSTPEPDSQLWTNQENAGILLDTVGYNIGRKLVRYLDGTFELQTASKAQAIATANRGNASTVVRLAGGDIFNSDPTSKAGDLSLSQDFVLPAAVSVSFPKYVVGNDPVPHFFNTRYQNQRPTTWYENSYGDSFELIVPITSGGLNTSGHVGTSATVHAVHSTAKALYSGEFNTNSGFPLNTSGLLSLSLQIATDYYDWQGNYALDESFPGTFNWVAEGLNDIIWTYSARARRACTRVMQTIWNQIIKEMQHSAHPLAGFTNIPPGVGGHSVSQTIRDSQLSGNVSTSLAQTLASGALSAVFNNVYYLPTQNRWKGKIDNEVILFEGTSGGINGLTVGIVYRGIDGTLGAEHANLSTVFQLTPNTTYGVNLSTYEKGQFVYPNEQTSGGIAAVNVVPQMQTVRVYSSSGVLLNNRVHYSGTVSLYNPTSGLYSELERIWVIERNQVALLSGLRYDGQLVGYSNGTSPSPIYLTDTGCGVPCASPLCIPYVESVTCDGGDLVVVTKALQWCGNGYVVVDDCGSGSGSGDCCFGTCGSAGVSATLTGTVTDKVGCFTLQTGTLIYTCQNGGGAGNHFWQLTSGDLGCGSSAGNINACSAGVAITPILSLGGGLTPVTADAGYTCSPFSAVFHYNDGAGNSCTITVVG